MLEISESMLKNFNYSEQLLIKASIVNFITISTNNGVVPYSVPLKTLYNITGIPGNNIRIFQCDLKVLILAKVLKSFTNPFGFAKSFAKKIYELNSIEKSEVLKLLKATENELSPENYSDIKFNCNRTIDSLSNEDSKQMVSYLLRNTSITITDLGKIFFLNAGTLKLYHNKFGEKLDPYYTDELKARISLNFEKKLAFEFSEEVFVKLMLTEDVIHSWSLVPEVQQEKLKLVNCESIKHAFKIHIEEWLLSDSTNPSTLIIDLDDNDNDNDDVTDSLENSTNPSTLTIDLDDNDLPTENPNNDQQMIYSNKVPKNFEWISNNQWEEEEVIASGTVAMEVSE